MENTQLMEQYDEIFGKGSSRSKFGIKGDMEIDEERK